AVLGLGEGSPARIDGGAFAELDGAVADPRGGADREPGAVAAGAAARREDGQAHVTRDGAAPGRRAKGRGEERLIREPDAGAPRVLGERRRGRIEPRRPV